MPERRAIAVKINPGPGALILRSLPGRQVVIPGNLSLCASDHSLMYGLRLLVSDTSLGAHLALMDDVAVLECVRRLLATGELEVITPVYLREERTGGMVPPPVAAPQPAPLPLSREEPDDSDPLDGVEAGVLLAADAAFCET